MTSLPNCRHAAISTVMQNNQAIPAGISLDLAAVLPTDTSYVTYTGSLTTPGCAEGVLWHVMPTPRAYHIIDTGTLLAARNV